MKRNIIFLSYFLFISSLTQASEYLIGCYYFAGWWRNPVPAHYLNGGADWRSIYPEREPIIGWFSDTQCLVDQEISIAALGGIDFFAFDFYTNKPDSTEFPGSQANNNNGLKYYLTSPNKRLMKFALFYVNATRYEITDPAEWASYADLWVYYFQDPQYLKINGKPVFIIQGGLQLTSEFGSLAAAQNALQVLRQKAQAVGFPDVLIACGVPRPDATLISKGVQLGYDFFTAYTADYSSLPVGPAEYSVLLDILPPLWNTFKQYSPIGYAPITIQGHDRRPVLKTNESYFINKTPALFNQQLQLAKTFIDQNPALWIDGTQKMIMMYAWNEIGEGGQVLPTVSESDAYLQEIEKVFNS